MFAKLKAALANLLGQGEAEVHAVVDALVADAQPMLAEFRATLLADVEKLIATAKVDEAKLAAEVAAEVAKLTGGTPAPVTPPVAS
jgi:hypothetical protein